MPLGLKSISTWLYNWKESNQKEDSQMKLLRQPILDLAGHYGYSVLKYPSSQFRTVPVFDLSVQFLMAVQGPNLQFIQVGANDGCFGDPLRKYILNFPWHGIVVEPQPDVFKKLRGNYDAVKDRLIFENAAITNAAGPITMYRAKAGDSDPDYVSTVSSMNAEATARQLHIQKSQLEPFSVQCATLNQLVDKHGMPHLDILQIDTEGHDFNVLKTLDLSRTAPLIIQLEHGHLQPKDVDKLVQHLDKNGYRVLYGGRQHDTIALHETFPLK